MISYFATQQWTFTNDNMLTLWKELEPSDRSIFAFNIKDMDWEILLSTYITGLRVYIVKDDLSTIPEAKIKWRRYEYSNLIRKQTLSS